MHVKVHINIFSVSPSTLGKLRPHGWSQVEMIFFLPILHITEWALTYCCLWVPVIPFCSVKLEAVVPEWLHR